MIFDGIYRLASSPLEVALLTLLALWFISWSLDRHAKAAQLFSTLHLRMLGAVFLRSYSQQSAGDVLGSAHSVALAAAAAKVAGAAAKAAPAPRSPTVGQLPPAASPSKDIASFRLPDHAIARSAGKARRRASTSTSRKQQQQLQQQQQPGCEPRGRQRVRWSLDAAGGQAGGQQVRTQPKPRTSVDFDAAPASPPRRTRKARGASLAVHRSAPTIQQDGTEGAAQHTVQAPAPSQQQAEDGARWRPRMQRIASGQELVELAAGAGPGSMRSSMDSAMGAAPVQDGASAHGAAAAAAVPNEPAGSEDEAAAGAASAALSSWLASLPSLPSLTLSWPPSPSKDDGNDVSSTGAGDGSAGALLPTMSSVAAATAAAAVARRVAASGTAAAAWASSTVDTVLRPLLPSASSGGLAASSLLWRTASNDSRDGGVGAPGTAGAAGTAGAELEHAASEPLPRDAAAAGEAVQGLADSGAASAADRRRMSLEGASARHYSRGAVTADPARQAALENLAVAARAQSSGATAGTVGGAAAACLGPEAGQSCLASVGLDGECPPEIRAHVTDEHMVQFAALAGEPAAVAAAAELGLPPAWAGGGSLLGGAAADGPAACSDGGWEQVVDRSQEGLSYRVWRQELRRGLFMYKSVAVFEGVAPRDLRPFHLDDHARNLWDENVIEIRRAKPESQPGRLHKHTEWCLHQYRSRFPRPLAAREYQYARRVWHRPADGGCYVVCRGMPLPDAGDGFRAVKVTDIVSASRIAAAPGSGGSSSEMVSLYFEDSGVRPGLAKMAVKGMWGYMQSYAAALRVFAEARRVAAAEYCAGAAGPGGVPARRRSADAAHASGSTASADRRRRRQLLPQLNEQGPSSAGEDAGNSSGDDSLATAFAAAARRLRRGAGAGAGPSRLGAPAANVANTKQRWAGRLAMLATIKMLHAMLSSTRR